MSTGRSGLGRRTGCRWLARRFVWRRRRKAGWCGWWSIRCAAGRPVAGGDEFVDVAFDVVTQLLGEPRALLTLLTGEEAPPLDGLLERLASAYPGLEVEVHEGGQPHYPLLLGAE